MPILASLLETLNISPLSNFAGTIFRDGWKQQLSLFNKFAEAALNHNHLYKTYLQKPLKAASKNKIIEAVVSTNPIVGEAGQPPL